MINFKVGDKVIVKDHIKLPRSIIGRTGTVKIMDSSCYVELDNDPEPSPIGNRFFGSSIEDHNNYLRLFTKLDNVLN